MNHFIQDIQGQVQAAGQWTMQRAEQAKVEVQAGLLLVRDESVKVFHQATEGCQTAAEKAMTFLIKNKDTLFFVLCSSTTLYFAPQLFVTSAVITVIIRVELAQYLKRLAFENLRDEKNPYLSILCMDRTISVRLI